MDSLPPKPALLLLAVALVLCFINTLAKKASVAVSDAWLLQKAEDGDKKAKRLFNALDKKPSKIMESFDFMAVFLFAIISFVSIDLLLGTAISASILIVVLLEIALCIIYTVFMIIIPEKIVAKNAEKISLAMVGYTLFIYGITRVPVWIARLLSKIFGVADDEVYEEVTEEEIRMMVDIGSESGAIDDDEKQMIHNIFEMDDKPVDEIMTHRTEACILWIEDSIDEWKKTIDETNHTRYPVCGESIDDVIGVITSRDFYRFLLGGGGDVKTLLREVFFIPDTIKADELLSKMQRENEHMGVVMDEFGGFQGLVTQEDLIEEIVGELYSEYDEPEIEDKDIVQIGENTWQISGSAEIEAVEEALSVKITEGDYKTFAGLILSTLEAIPADGETPEVETDAMRIKVTSIVDHRIEEATVTLIENEKESQ